MDNQNNKANTTIARKLRMLRAAKNVGREEFSRYMGTSIFTLSHWETGVTVPPPDQTARIDAEFAEAITELFEDSSEGNLSHEKYLVCLRCITDLSDTHLKDLNSCIGHLLIIREKKRRQNIF